MNINICTLLLGEKREELVKNVIVSSNGSAKHYVNSLVTEMHLAGEDVPDVFWLNLIKFWLNLKINEK